MPEGDTIFRAARHLRKALLDTELTRLQLRDLAVPEKLRLPRITGIESRGKNLLIHLQCQENTWVLYTHMKMTGSWHIYRPGEPWRKNPKAAVAQLQNSAFIAVCFSAPVVELMSAARSRRHPFLSKLGPDILVGRPDFKDMIHRIYLDPDLSLGETLLDQRKLAGIGNVYKSEVCFQERLNPLAPVGLLTPQRMLQVLKTARRMMSKNLDTLRRTTRHSPPSRTWVYGRAQAPCFACGTTIEKTKQGESGRSTYFCPACQGVR